MCGVDLVRNKHYSRAGMRNNPIQYHHTEKLLEIIANYCNENSLSNQNVPSPHMIRVCMQGCTVFCRCYDQATLADFVYFRWLFYSLGGRVGSVGSLWYTFRFPSHQDWSDLST